MYRWMFVVSLVLITNTAFSKGDTSWIRTEGELSCSSNEIQQCFVDSFLSDDDWKAVEAIYFYLDNYRELSEFYSLDKFLKKLAVISQSNSEGAFLLESSIYYHGDPAVQDIDKAITILEQNDFFDKSNPKHLLALGTAYHQKYVSTGRSNAQYYERAKQNLLDAYLLSSEYATRPLAHLLVKSHDPKEFALAGTIFEHFAKTGIERDMQSYQLYLQVAEQLAQKD